MGAKRKRPMNDERFFKGWFVFVAILALGWIGFLVWAIAEVVGWLTSK